LLNVQLATELEIKVVNTLGQIVFSSEEKILSGTLTKAVSLNNLSDGIYFIEIKSENVFIRKKIVLEK